MIDSTPASGLSRRRLLGGALAGGAALAASGLLGGCAGRPDAMRVATDDRWRQFAGTTLNFISENTSPTKAIAADLKPFTDLTGININIVTLELSAMVQKVALDLASGQAQYQVIYADPYQVLALPYDCPTMIWQYRQDLFDKYRDRMAHDLGFDPMPSGQTTWDQYYKIAKWFNDNTRDVRYGTGHQAKQHDSLMNDFSNVLWAYGGDYFDHGDQVGRLGVVDPGPSRLGEQPAIDAAGFYQRLLSIADPGSLTWDWDGLGSAFAAGRIAMCPNWHEYAADNEKAMPGKVGYAPLPRGPVRSANMYGGTGVGISANALPNERKAAWLFLVWATAPDTELRNLKSKKGGGTPTRTSVYEMPEVRAAEQRPTTMPNILTAPVMREVWSPQNIGMRPKIPMWNECDTAIYTQLSRMLVGDASPTEAMREASKRFDRITARGWVS
jgi:multiple sugar transport system substrate-binding protein